MVTTLAMNLITVFFLIPGCVLKLQKKKIKQIENLNHNAIHLHEHDVAATDSLT